MREAVTGIICVAVMLLMVILPDASLSGARMGMELFLTVMLPAQLPINICASLLIEGRFLDRLLRRSQRLCNRLFSFPPDVVLCFAAGLLGGYPTGARLLGEYCPPTLDGRHRLRAALFCSAAGPGYLLGTIGMGMLASPSMGLCIAMSHWLSVIFLCVVTKPAVCPIPPQDNVKPANPSSSYFTHAVAASASSMVTVAGYIIFFACVSTLLSTTGILAFCSRPFAWLLALISFDTSMSEGLLTGLIEVTTGSNMLSSLSASLYAKSALLCFMVSFGGLSVIAQSMAFLKRIGVSWASFTLYKLIQALLSSVLFSLIFLVSLLFARLTASTALQTWLGIGSVALLLCIVLSCVSAVRSRLAKRHG